MIGNVPKIPDAFLFGGGQANQTVVPDHLAYVFGQVMYNKRGVVGFDHKTDCLVLYMKLDQLDQQVRPALGEIEEIWLALRRKE